jgi:hypothetical protein
MSEHGDGTPPIASCEVRSDRQGLVELNSTDWQLVIQMA